MGSAHQSTEYQGRLRREECLQTQPTRDVWAMKSIFTATLLDFRFPLQSPHYSKLVRKTVWRGYASRNSRQVPYVSRASYHRRSVLKQRGSSALEVKEAEGLSGFGFAILCCRLDLNISIIFRKPLYIGLA
jgi:hypothetical protein